MGIGVTLLPEIMSPQEAAKRTSMYKNHAFEEYVSELISLDRSAKEAWSVPDKNWGQFSVLLSGSRPVYFCAYICIVYSWRAKLFDKSLILVEACLQLQTLNPRLGPFGIGLFMKQGISAECALRDNSWTIVRILYILYHHLLFLTVKQHFLHYLIHYN